MKDEEAIAARVEQVDQEATAWLSNMESRALSLQKRPSKIQTAFGFCEECGVMC